MSDPAAPLPGRLEAALARAAGGEPKDASPEAAPLAIHYTEALDDGRTLSISPQVEALLGCSQVEWMADPLLWVEMIHPDDRDRVQEECWESNRKEVPFVCEYRMVARDGRVVWVRDEAKMVRGSAGQRLCWEGMMVEITAQKEADAAAGTHLEPRPSSQ